MPKAITDRAILEYVLRTDFIAFVHKVFVTISPADVYRHNWHIEAIAYELMRAGSGENLRLIITQPPRSLKSICASVAFAAWVLGRNPSLRFACVSYSNELATVFARQFRTVVNSAWYRALFPQMRLLKETETECLTTQGGGRIAISIGGTFTGRGADIIVIDDPLKAEEAQSEKARNFANEWFSSTLVSRLNDKASGVIILVMQRLHEDDLSGKLLADGNWNHLDLPAIAVADQKVQIAPGKYYCRRMGDVLHAERESRAVLDKIKSQMGSLAFSAQYQQRPVPLEGNLIKRRWFKWYDRLPEGARGARIAQSWDVATCTGTQNDWSVCTTWLIDQRRYYLLDVWRGRLEYPDIRRKVIALAKAFQARTLLIEKAGPGQHLFQELQAPPPGIPVPIGIKPEGDKVVRMEAQSACIEAGQIILPREALWFDILLNELLAFSNCKHDDQVDSVSQFLNWAATNYRHQANSTICGPKVFTSGHDWPHWGQ